MDNVNVQASSVNINNYYSASDDAAVDFSQFTIQQLLDMLGAMDPEAGANAIADSAGKAIVDMIKEKLEGDDSIPQAKKDEINQVMDAVEQANGLDTPAEIQDLMTALREKFKDSMQKILEEEIKETAEGTGGEAGGAEGKGDGKGGAAEGAEHWMVSLSKLMSKFAGDHLEKMINIQSEISILEGNAPIDPGADATDDQKRAFGEAQAKHASRFTQLTAQAQAHTQMFKMAQEMTTTIIKSLGEALNSTVRKQ